KPTIPLRIEEHILSERRNAVLDVATITLRPRPATLAQASRFAVDLDTLPLLAAFQPYAGVGFAHSRPCRPFELSGRSVARRTIVAESPLRAHALCRRLHANLAAFTLARLWPHAGHAAR